MSRLRVSTRLYIVILSAVALALTLLAVAHLTAPTLWRGVLALVMVALLTLAYLFPLRFAPDTKVTLGTSLLFASVLLFNPPLAILVAALGRVVSQILRRAPAPKALLNGSQTVLQVGVGSLLLASAGWDTERLRFDQSEQLAVIPVAVLAMYLVNTFSVAGVLAIESGRSPFEVWWGSVTSHDALERLSQLILGLLIAIVADVSVWAMPLLVLPAAAVYRLCERQGRLHDQNRRLAHQALHDPLTGLPNRVLFLDRLERALAPGYGKGPAAVLFVDLDNLKSVNDTLGHHAGDELLRAVGVRLAGCLRPGDIVARLGGDEFAVLLQGAVGLSEATAVAERILIELGEPLWIEGREVSARASIGVALGRPGSDRSADLLRDADLAMYRAKDGGKARYEVFAA